MPVKIEAIETTLKDLSAIFNDWSMQRRVPLHTHARKVLHAHWRKSSDRQAQIVTDTLNSHGHKRLQTHLDLVEKLVPLAMSAHSKETGHLLHICVFVEAHKNVDAAVQLATDLSENMVHNAEEIRTKIQTARDQLDIALNVVDGKVPARKIENADELTREIADLYRDAARTMTEELRIHLAYLGTLDMRKEARLSPAEMMALKSGRAAVETDITRTHAMLNLSKGLFGALYKAGPS